MHRDRVSLVSLPASSSIHKLIVMFQLPELQGDDGDYHCSRNYSPKSMSPPAYTRRFRAAQSKYLIVFRRVHKTPQLHCIRILFLSKTILWQCENLRWDRGEMVKVGYSACLRMLCFACRPVRERVQVTLPVCEKLEALHIPQLLSLQSPPSLQDMGFHRFRRLNLIHLT